MTKKKPKKFKHVGWVGKIPRGALIMTTTKRTKFECIRALRKMCSLANAQFKASEWDSVKVFVEE